MQTKVRKSAKSAGIGYNACNIMLQKCLPAPNLPGPEPRRPTSTAGLHQASSLHHAVCDLTFLNASFDSSADGAHQVPLQPLQFDSLALHHPDAQLPPQLLLHLQQLGAGAGVGGGDGGAGVGSGVGAPATLKSKQEIKVSGGLLPRHVGAWEVYAERPKVSVSLPTLLKSLQFCEAFHNHRPTADSVGHEKDEGTWNCETIVPPEDPNLQAYIAGLLGTKLLSRSP